MYARDLHAAIAFWTERLGFTCEGLSEADGWASLTRDRVTVMVASDNTRDPFYAYGDLDLLEVYREATRILHFDHSDRAWLQTVVGALAIDIFDAARSRTSRPASVTATEERRAPG